MAATTTSTTDDLLRLACARNSAVELRCERNDGTTTRARTRLLFLDADSMLADQPQYSDRAQRIPCDRPISVFVMINGQRYEFSSAIEQEGVPIRLNENHKLRGIRLRRPVEIRESQRRAHYRVSVLGHDPITATMARAHAKIRNACPLDTIPLPVRLVNMSAGGAAVLVPPRYRRAVLPQQLYYMSFTLPYLEHEFLMLASVRHTQIVRASDALRAGLAFLPWDGSDLKEDLREVVRFVARTERRSLRRRK